MNATEIIFSLLGMSENAGIEFLQASQRETGYTPETYYEFLNTELSKWEGKWIEATMKQIEAGHISLSQQKGIGIPLFTHGLKSHLFKQDIDTMKLRLSKYLDIVQKLAPADKVYPDKWYALLYRILVELGKKEPLSDKMTAIEIIKYGKNRYKTGQGFYRELLNINYSGLNTYIKSMTQKDRVKWKKIITEISGQDADVVSWLKKQPT